MITKTEVEVEIKNFIKVWLSVFLSLCYCYAIGKIVPKGTKRLVCVLPIVCLFLYLPLNLSSPHLGGTTAFFIAWLANFKLLLFVFGKGPLSLDPSIPLSRFVAVSCLPIKIQHHKHINGRNQEIPFPKSHSNGQNKENKENPPPKKSKEGPLNYAIKGILLAMLVHVYDYSDYMHPKIILLFYCFHIYFLLEIILAMGATMARTLLGLVLEPQFNEPYLSTSLQDFWGKRWNLMVTSILRPTVYEPTLNIFTRVTGSREWAPLPAVFGTFLVSAIMHELMFYYLGRMRPTWEITCFFLLHGACVTVEVGLKKAFTGRCRLPWLISGPLTVGFVLVTGLWLFIPQFSRCKIDVRAFEEYAAIGAFLKNTSQRFANPWLAT